MKGNDTKRQILLSYYESDEPIDKVTMSRTKRKPIPNAETPMDKKQISKSKQGE